MYYYDHHYTIPALLLGPAPHPTPSVIFQPFLKTVTRPRVYKIISVPELIISHRDVLITVRLNMTSWDPALLCGLRETTQGGLGSKHLINSR